MRDPAIDPDMIGLRLQFAIVDHGTVAEAARLCQMSKSSLEAYLYHGNLPGSRALARLCCGLGVSADWLLFGEGAQ